jgi:ribose-phosphate pyrophosphokinase
MNPEEVRIIAGNSHPSLAKSIAEYLKIPLTGSKIDRFENGEIRVQIMENVRRRTAIVVQTGYGWEQPRCSINDHIMELLIVVDALRRSSVDEIWVVIPNYPYARQDKKDVSRAPISGGLFARLLEEAGVTRVITLELHASQISGFFRIPVDNLYAVKTVADFIHNSLLKNPEDSKDLVLVSPDAGGIKRMDSLASRLKLKTVIMHKSRNHEEKSMVLNTVLVGEQDCVRGKKCLIIDDMCDTGGTIVKAAETLMEHGAREVAIVVIHGILSGPAIERLNAAEFITEVYVTNSIPQEVHSAQCPKLKVIDISHVLAEAVRRLYTGESISTMFN